MIADKGEVGRFYQTIVHGTYGGSLLVGLLFGFARSPSAMIDGPAQFDFYAGGGLDLAFLGFGELDGNGNINVSRLGGLTVGPGGFIDIAQNAKKVIFCGTFDTKGSSVESAAGGLKVHRQGQVRKLVKSVEQITYLRSASLKARPRSSIHYGTGGLQTHSRRCRVDGSGAGIDIRRDILDVMGFTPRVPIEPQLMDAALLVD
jgi:acyl CoA:acetate/3-ketoacid CoA transferase